MATTPFPEAVKKLRSVAGMTLEDVGNRSRLSSSAICRWEKGQSTPRRRGDVERVDAAIGAQGELLRAWTAHTSGSTLPPWMQDAARIEEAAASLEYISPVLVPGILQCPEYAEMIFRFGQPLETREEVTRLARARAARFEYLRQNRNPLVAAVFPQTALTTIPPAPRKAQAAHLMELAIMERVSVYLVPEGSVLLGVTSPFLLARLADGGRAGSTDHISGNVLLDEHADWNRLDALVKDALALSLPADRSLTLLGELAE